MIRCFSQPASWFRFSVSGRFAFREHRKQRDKLHAYLA
jgi:hypothetical protein